MHPEKPWVPNADLLQQKRRRAVLLLAAGHRWPYSVGMRRADRLTRLLASYGGYHRDPRNRLTHYFGVPVIIYAVLVPMALYHPTVLGSALSLDRVVVAFAAGGYVCLDVGLGLALSAVLALLAFAAESTAAVGSSLALALAAIVFVLGWTMQLLGHRLEGNRPALLTNLAQVLVAPLYLIAELGFALGLRRSLWAAIGGSHE